MGSRRLKKFLAGLMVELTAQGSHFCFEHGLIKKEEIRPVAPYMEKLGESLHRQLLRDALSRLLPKSGMGIK